MHSYLVIFLAPLLNEYLRFSECGEYLPIQELIPNLPGVRGNPESFTGVARISLEEAKAMNEFKKYYIWIKIEN